MDTNPHESERGPLDLSKWRNVPAMLMGAGALLSLIGALWRPTEFAYAWLLAFMFFLSLCLGALFLVIVHHLFDAGWSVPIRRLRAYCVAVVSVHVLPLPADRVFSQEDLSLDGRVAQGPQAH